MSTNPKLATVADFARVAHLSYTDAKKALAGIKPHQVLPWGDKQITYYLADDVMPLAKDYERKYHQRKADMLAKKNPPAAAPVAADASAAKTPPVAFDISLQLENLTRQVLDMQAELRDLNDLRDIILSLKVVPDQNRAVFAKLQSLAEQQSQILDAITAPEPSAG